ncbi:MAG: flavin reductase family protein [Bacteroidales bacterium]|nr:flavin reductase family protein [Bacteroidales bacterium]
MNGKQVWKPGTMLNPVPVVMVSCGTMGEKTNIITVAWAGTICSDPAMLSISVRKERFSHKMIVEKGKFVVNLVTTKLAKIADWCGVKSGKDYDKFLETGLTAEKAETSDCPIISQSPVNIECTVDKIIELGSHDMILAKVDAVDVSDKLIDPKTGALQLYKADLAVYSHGFYYNLGYEIGRFGFSVKKNNTPTNKTRKK